MISTYLPNVLIRRKSKTSFNPRMARRDLFTKPAFCTGGKRTSSRHLGVKFD